jgi:hypothetical protein
MAARAFPLFQNEPFFPGLNHQGRYMKLSREEHKDCLITGCRREYLNLRRRNWWVGGWTKLHNKELHNLYASPNIIRVIK